MHATHTLAHTHTPIQTSINALKSIEQHTQTHRESRARHIPH